MATLATIVPTVEDVLTVAHVCNGFYQWGVDGGIVTLSREQLLPALEAAYDPSMENWPFMVEIEA
ncbi:MAG: hypothetical protein VKO39_03455 [Cyanobacteriota bacterium]|nr:hypothetical protein [Cyanobacteriota bacterium]